MLRPAFLWLLSIFGFAAYFLGRHEGGSALISAGRSQAEAAAHNAAVFNGAVTDAQSWFSQAFDASCASMQSNAAGEALYLSFRNALFMSGWEDVDTARRVFGCLYGVSGERPLIPLDVSAVSLIQTIVSAVLLFLFLLALRNLLKVR